MTGGKYKSRLTKSLISLSVKSTNSSSRETTETSSPETDYGKWKKIIKIHNPLIQKTINSHINKTSLPIIHLYSALVPGSWISALFEPGTILLL